MAANTNPPKNPSNPPKNGMHIPTNPTNAVQCQYSNQFLIYRHILVFLFSRKKNVVIIITYQHNCYEQLVAVFGMA